MSAMSVTHKRRVLVTGGTGLVGKALEEYIVQHKANTIDEEWIFLSSGDADLRQLDEVKRIFNQHRPVTHVVHLAAKVGGLFDNMAHNLDFFLDNMHINDNVLAVCKQEAVNKVVSCLSTCIFPDRTTYPIDETMIHNGPPHQSNIGYSYAKRMIDVLNQGYREQYGCNFTAVIPCNIFGPNDNYADGSAHVIPALIRRMRETVRSDSLEFRVLGTGRPLRQFIYSKDLAKLIVWVLRYYDHMEPLILSVDENAELSIKEVAEHIANASGFQGKLVFDTTQADGQYKKTASNAKLRKLLPNFKFTPFEQAIGESVNWYKENENIARK